MPLRALTCPKCGAGLPMTAKLRVVECAFCRASVSWQPTMVSANDYRKAYEKSMIAPVGAHVIVRSNPYAFTEVLGRGSACEVFRAKRARALTELVWVKVLRSEGDRDLLDHEFSILRGIQETAPSRFVPIPLGRPVVVGGEFAGKKALVLRAADGFSFDLETVRRLSGGALDPRHSIWILKRILDQLSFLHALQIVHGSVLPSHILLHPRDHGAMLIGYSAAVQLRAKHELQVVDPDRIAFYPDDVARGGHVSCATDIAMAARCMHFVLGSDQPQSAPCSVPSPLRDFLAELSEGRYLDANAAKNRASEVAREVFGAPAFLALHV